MSAQEDESRKGRRVALVIAGTAVFWILSELIGAQMGWSNRIRALLTMIAGAGFIWALWMIFQIWRARQDNQG
ncbi:DUF5337 domain-containing protein [Roseovarius sp. CAU 1744]|uniref:DUF5337 domain-containing protein n=1 Tax=Roseovarius sp. CAU 1744 TaxID=3140368 RepID=UPI00325A7589